MSLEAEKLNKIFKSNLGDNLHTLNTPLINGFPAFKHQITKSLLRMLLTVKLVTSIYDCSEDREDGLQVKR